ncbi:NAD(P)H-quinone oxidoreductase subunit I [Moorella thermoacetica]|uniref:2-oxoglutarate-acceptor oxidoreductase subunit OorD n=1 Tax=Neomoorella thermoacetica TaxID=1525 RepID=A0AAC9HJM3_NEOTH|nr:4Fe-4S binding protein [Moorella thermoacetica]AOQ25103.1 2-oxoglutarate-acceptor oxidoreductase subunit OorD [Moorella thermoacetica]TYL15366.1 NAD(P)H-quinone oxidoreductase subunit I [Moorella thermoacetica]
MTVKFDEERCKGCELCVAFCPKKIIHLDKDRMNSKGFHPAVVTEEDKCIACGFCAQMCPDVAIFVYR